MLHGHGVYRWTTSALAAFAALVAPVLASAQSPTSSPSAVQPSTPPVRPGDMIRLKIWREPEMSGDFAVEEDGVVVLPRIGPVAVRDEPAERLKNNLIARYRPYFNHDAISVVLLRRVQILGAVRNPGLYPVDPTMTVGDALALAGGVTPQGRPDRLRLIRQNRALDVRLLSTTPVGASPIQSGDQIYVEERNWLARTPAVIAASISAVAAVLIATRRR